MYTARGRHVHVQESTEIFPDERERLPGTLGEHKKAHELAKKGEANASRHRLPRISASLDLSKPISTARLLRGFISVQQDARGAVVDRGAELVKSKLQSYVSYLGKFPLQASNVVGLVLVRDNVGLRARFLDFLCLQASKLRLNPGPGYFAWQR